MKDSEKTTKNCAIVAVKKERISYSQPRLRIFGSIRQLTQGQSSRGSDWRSRRRRSDSAAKENVVRIGDHPLGFGLYLFDYKAEFKNEWGEERQFGVMANEVEVVVPEAVSIDRDGFKMVDYAILGIIMPSGSLPEKFVASYA